MRIQLHDGYARPGLSTLLQAAQEGAVNLFLGAGASKGAHNRFESDPPTAKELTEILQERADLPRDTEATLRNTYDAAIRRLGQKSVRQILSEYYYNCMPSWQLLIPRFLWHTIYTLNIDDVLDNAYRLQHERIQDAVNIDYDEAFKQVGVDQVPLVHLHGRVASDVPLVFSTADYARAGRSGYSWHTILSDALFERPFLFVGTRLDEPDIDTYVHARGTRHFEDRPYSYLIAPDPSEFTVATLGDVKIHCVDATGEQFFNWLDAELGDRLPKSQRIARDPRNAMFKGMSPEDVRAFSSAVELVTPTSVSLALPTPHDFYSGDEPVWGDIAKNKDAIFTGVKSYLATLGDEGGTQSSLSALVGAPGCGKTTMLMRIAWDASLRGTRVYMYKGKDRLPVEPLIDALKASPPGTLLVVDNAVRHINELADLFFAIETEDMAVHVLTAERTTRFRRVEVSPIGGAINPIPLSTLKDDDIEVLLNTLKLNAALGELHHLGKQEQAEYLKRYANRQLLVAMMEITKGMKFEKILNEEYHQVEPEGARQVYETVALCHHLGEGVRLSVAARAMDIHPEVIWDWLRQDGEGSLYGIVRRRDSILTTRHPVIASKIVSSVTSRQRIRVMRSVLRAVAPYVNVDALSRRTPESMLLRQFLDFEDVRDIADGDEQLIESFYQDLQEEYDWNSKYWAQRALFERSRRRFRAAYDHASAAVARDGVFLNRHVLGIVLLSWATERADGLEKALERFWEGWSQLELSGDGRRQSDEYVATAMLHGVVEFAEAWGPESIPHMKDFWDVALRRGRDEGIRRLSDLQGRWLKVAVERR